jgi:hypothetical protein
VNRGFKLRREVGAVGCSEASSCSKFLIRGRRTMIVPEVNAILRSLSLTSRSTYTRSLAVPSGEIRRRINGERGHTKSALLAIALLLAACGSKKRSAAYEDGWETRLVRRAQWCR